VKRRITPLLLTAALAVLAVGAGGGALVASAFSGGTKTVVRQVTVSGSQPASSSSSLTVNDVYRRAYKGVVQITVTSQDSTPEPFGGSGTQQAQGSGFVYDSSGDIVTNEHVVANASSVTVTFWNGAKYKAHVVGTDASTDLAVVKVDAPSSLLVPLTLGDSSAVAVGDGVVAIGSPFGLAETVTSGIVSALHRQMTSPSGFAIQDSIQTDAAINHGNSGGPLLNLQGRVIGVTSQIESDSGGSDGVGFAIPSNTVRSVVQQLLANGKAVHAYLGVAVESAANGARIAQVRSGGPAKAAGLHVGDVVTAVNGHKISSAGELQSAIDSKKPGDTVTLTIKRNGTTHSIRVKLGTRPT
jgi:putative serine protease PepD